MKRYLLILLLIILSLYLEASDFHIYSLELINNIQTGKAEGMIGWEPPFAGSQSVPQTFTIANNRIYIPDYLNDRINVYTIEFNFINSIIEDKNKYLSAASKMYVDNQGNIIGIYNLYGLKKIDSTGKEIFVILQENLPKQIYKHDNFFLLENEIFFYNDKNEIQYIDKNGNIQSTEQATALLQQLSLKNQETQTQLSKSVLDINTNKQLLNNLNKKNDLLMINDNFYSSMFYQHEKYYDQIKPIRDSITSKKLLNKSASVATPKHIEIDPEKLSLHLIGYDNDHNSYWRGIEKRVEGIQNYAIIIYSKYGTLLDAFYYGQSKDYSPNLVEYPASNAVIAVAPKGDVYFLSGNSEKYTMYKVTRQW